MGEYAEMMLDGTCCAGCGEYLGSNNGFSTYCAGCQSEMGLDEYGSQQLIMSYPTSKAHACDECGKTFRTAGGLKMHKQSKHVDRRPIKCPGCGKKCKGEDGLRMHMAAKGCDPRGRQDPIDDDFDVIEDYQPTDARKTEAE